MKINDLRNSIEDSLNDVQDLLFAFFVLSIVEDLSNKILCSLQEDVVKNELNKIILKGE